MSTIIKLTSMVEEKRQFTGQVSIESGQPVQQCYQCGKCTAGCPVAFAMDVAPNRVIRMVQLGLREKVLASNTIWICANCSTCTVRCPRNVNIAGVMDSLRIMAGKEGRAATTRARRVDIFNKNFLFSIKHFGRLYEFGTMLLFNIKSGNPFQNADTGLNMLARGKLKLVINKTRNMDQVKRIFNEIKSMEEQNR